MRFVLGNGFWSLGGIDAPGIAYQAGEWFLVVRADRRPWYSLSNVSSVNVQL